ncbi:Large ribosomal RNA subunit accumulation protein YCED-like protein 2 chloroplastic [Bienertia sinuspersici]
MYDPRKLGTEMANATHLSSAKTINPLQIPVFPPKPKSSFLQITRFRAARKNIEGPLITKKASKFSRRLITIPASSGRWPGKWTCEYIVSLRDLQLDDLVEHGRKMQRFMSVFLFRRVITSIARTCSSCSSPYDRMIDTSISVWVLPEGRDDPSTQMPEIGSDDPSVIYVRPGFEADLDSLIQDTIRLQTAVKETCSESCEKAEPKLHFIGDQRTASLDRRWSRLLQLRNKIR